MPPACAVVPLLLGLVSAVLQAPSGPVLFADEIAYLGIGVHLSARDAVVQLAELEFYSPGYGLVLAPFLSVVPFDPWAVAVVVNFVSLATIGPLLFLLLREISDLPRTRAAAVAAVAACTPAVILQVTRAWPEVLLTAVFALWALLLARFVGSRPAGAYGLAAAATAALAMTIHRRAIVVVVVTAALLTYEHLSTARTQPGQRARALTWLAGSLGLLGAHQVLNGALDRSIKARLYVGADLVDGTERAVELARGDVVQQLVGHGWAATQATIGFALFGTVAAVVLLWPDRFRSLGIALAVAMGGSVAVSAVAVADGPRVDHLFYERYVAPLAVVAVTAGLAALVDERRRLSAAWLLALPATTALLLVTVPSSRFEGNVQKLTAPTLATLEHVHRWTTVTFLQELSPVRTTAVVTVVAGVVFAARRRSGLLALAGVGATFALLVVVGSVVTLRPFLDHWEGYASPLADAIRADLDDGGPIGATPGAPEPLRAVVQYRTGHPRVVAVDPRSCPDVGHVIAEAGFEPRWPAEVVLVTDDPPALLLRPRC